MGDLSAVVETAAHAGLVWLSRPLLLFTRLLVAIGVPLGDLVSDSVDAMMAASLVTGVLTLCAALFLPARGSEIAVSTVAALYAVDTATQLLRFAAGLLADVSPALVVSALVGPSSTDAPPSTETPPELEGPSILVELAFKFAAATTVTVVAVVLLVAALRGWEEAGRAAGWALERILVPLAIVLAMLVEFDEAQKAKARAEAATRRENGESSLPRCDSFCRMLQKRHSSRQVDAPSSAQCLVCHECLKPAEADASVKKSLTMATGLEVRALPCGHGVHELCLAAEPPQPSIK